MTQTACGKKSEKEKKRREMEEGERVQMDHSDWSVRNHITTTIANGSPAPYFG